MTNTPTISLLLSFQLFALAANGADWPQLGGPDRNYAPAVPELGTSWPADGPRLIWERDLGLGYSGIAIVGDDLYTMYREGDEEIVLAARAATGETRWEHRYAAPFADGMRMEHGSGPHVTPLIADGKVFTVGILGLVQALDGGGGEVVWSRDLVATLGAAVLDRGYSASPLAYGDSIILPVGGSGPGLVALDRSSGAVLWKSEDFASSYSSPLLIDLGGQTQLVYLNGQEVVGFDPATGKRLWGHPHPCRNSLNISVPVWSGEDNLLFVSSAYDGGSRVLKLSLAGEGAAAPTEVEELWAHKQMRLHLGNAIRIGDWVYASNGDFGPVPFTAVNVKDGEIGWRTRDVARAFQVLADGKLILLDEDGVLYLASAAPQALDIHARHQLFAARSWTPPTLVGRTLYTRDVERMVALALP